MDQRTLLYVSLLFISFLVWQAWQLDNAPQPITPAVEAGQTVPAGSVASIAAAQTGDDLPEANSASIAGEQPGQASSANGQLITVKTDVYDIVLNSVGGDILSVELPGYPVSLTQKDTPYVLLQKNHPRYMAQSGLIHDRVANQDLSSKAPNHYALYSSDSTSYVLEDGQDALNVVLSWTDGAGINVTKTFKFKRGQYFIDVEHTINNGSAEAWIGRQYRQIRHGPAIDSDGSKLLYTFTGGAYYTDKYNKVEFDDLREEPVNIEVPAGGWISVVQHYFISAWYTLADQPEKNLLYSKVVNTPNSEEYILGMRSDAATVAPGASETFNSQFYAGPKKQSELETLGKGLELTVDYGIFTIFSKPIFWMMTKIHSIVQNWGWSIILLTIMIKLAFYRLSASSYRSMAKMKAVGPKLQSVREKHGSDKQAQQAAMMELYKKEKINPLGGCLPIVVQIPVFIALYWVLLESVELRQAPWMLWIEDLSIKDPLYILPVIMGISMFVQQKLNPPPPDPMQAKLMMALPFVFTVFFAFFPAGLVLYWVVNNLLSISQQWYITKNLANESD